MIRAACCLVCCAISTTAIAQPTSEAQPLAKHVKELVDRLHAGTPEDRQAAENELVALGVGVLDELPAEHNRMPQEVKSRLTRIRDRLEKEAGRIATQAATISLTGELKLSEILGKFETLTGNRVIDYRNQIGQTSTDPNIEVDFSETPFWEALDHVMSETNLMIDPYSGGMRTLALVEAVEGQEITGERIAYGGLFRFDPQAIRSVRNLRNPSNHQMTLTIEIMWEPRVMPLAISHPIDKLEIVDQNGNALAVNSQQPAIETSVQNEVASVEVDLPLELPDRSVTRIASLKGEILALVPGRDATFRFENVDRARNVERENSGVKVILQRVRKNANVQQVRILVRFDGTAGALENHRGWIYGNKAYLVNPNGTQIEMAGFETTRQQPNEVGLAYNFVASDVKGYSFVYKTPAAIVQMPVKYELKNIALP